MVGLSAPSLRLAGSIGTMRHLLSRIWCEMPHCSCCLHTGFESKPTTDTTLSEGCAKAPDAVAVFPHWGKGDFGAVCPLYVHRLIKYPCPFTSTKRFQMASH